MLFPHFNKSDINNCKSTTQNFPRKVSCVEVPSRKNFCYFCPFIPIYPMSINECPFLLRGPSIFPYFWIQMIMPPTYSIASSLAPAYEIGNETFRQKGTSPAKLKFVSQSSQTKGEDADNKPYQVTRIEELKLNAKGGWLEQKGRPITRVIHPDNFYRRTKALLLMRFLTSSNNFLSFSGNRMCHCCTELGYKTN